jgi:protein NrfC
MLISTDRFEPHPMGGISMNSQKGSNLRIARRDFLKVTGAIVIVAGVGGCKPSTTEESPAPTNTLTPTDTPGLILIPESGIPPADGYLLVDIQKCQGCASCMLACSLIHEGVQGLSLSRIQIIQNSFESFPHDLTIEQCRQCLDPPCVEICPVDALEPDPEFGNVRIVDKDKCIGCGLCYETCPYTPSRAFLAPDKEFENEAKSRKCDLCAYAPFHWDEEGGGPDGKQACVEVCPVGAIMFTKEIPEQDGDGGYKVNLRDENWGLLGFPTS